MELTAESEIPVPTSVRRGFGAIRPGSDADPVAEIMHRDKPEAVPTFLLPARLGILSENPQINPKPPFHKDKF